jgi:hypothetical protein
MKTLFVALLLGSSLFAEAQSNNPRAACGAAATTYNVKLHDEAPQPALAAPGKGLAYFIQDAGRNAGIG